MRQELKNLRLAVDREEERALKAPKARPRAKSGARARTQWERQGGTEDSGLCAYFQPEKDWEEKWEDEEGKRSDPEQVADPVPIVGGGASPGPGTELPSGPGSVAVRPRESLLASLAPCPP